MIVELVGADGRHIVEVWRKVKAPIGGCIEVRLSQLSMKGLRWKSLKVCTFNQGNRVIVAGYQISFAGRRLSRNG